jgi:uncharacterized membrane protein YeaQ/YmgE (transglycosylase-associated protein family)
VLRLATCFERVSRAAAFFARSSLLPLLAYRLLPSATGGSISEQAGVDGRARDIEGGCTMLTIIGLIILGLIAGIIAKAIMPGKDPGGLIITILLGIAGSFLGGWLIGEKLLGYGDGDSGPGFIMKIILAVVGAIILLAVYRLVKGRSMRV